MHTRLTVSGVCVKRGGQTVLQGIDLQLAEAELLAVIGPNGAGKSTLLQCMAGLLEPAAGTVQLNGVAPDSIAANERARKLAYLAQRSTLDFPLTVAQVIELGRFPHRETAQQSRAIAALAAQALQLTHLLERPYTRLSGGEQQRVQNARALCQLLENAEELRCAEGSVLLLDEPVAALDWSYQQQLMQQLRELVGNGLSAIVVLHDLNLAARFADRIALLDRGRLRCCDTAAEALNSDTLSEVYQVAVAVMPHPRDNAPLVYR